VIFLAWFLTSYDMGAGDFDACLYAVILDMRGARIYLLLSE
jgi:hypothetical protein